MNKSTAAYIIFFVFSFVLTSCTEKQDKPDHLSEFMHLYSSHKYYALADKYDEIAEDLSGTDSLLAEAVMYSVFNRPKVSNKILSSRIFDEIKKGAKSKLQLIRLKLMHRNYTLQNRYAAAYETAVLLLRYANSSLIDQDELKQISNLTNIWKSLYDVPELQVISKGKIVSDLYFDKAGLMQVPVQSGYDEIDFVLDTGAGLSVISRTAAERLGLTIIEDKYKAGTTTGKDVEAVLGVAGTILIAGVEFRNVVFFVLDDKDLYFEHRDYKINGIIGLPVIRAMNKLTFGGSTLRIQLNNSQEEISQSNIFFSGTMLLTEFSAGITGMMLLDTGSWNTVLYSSYYRMIKDTLTSCKTDTLTIYGAGSKRRTEAVIIDEFRLTAAGQKITLRNIPVYTDPATAPSDYISGTLGADIFKLYDHIDIDFGKMVFRAYKTRM